MNMMEKLEIINHHQVQLHSIMMLTIKIIKGKIPILNALIVENMGILLLSAKSRLKIYA
jgi:hypothetical protein